MSEKGIIIAPNLGLRFIPIIGDGLSTSTTDTDGASTKVVVTGVMASGSSSSTRRRLGSRQPLFSCLLSI
jgi:hypothetical protein